MFESMKEHPDLIFLDSTVRLFEVQTSIEDYLGNDLIAMIHRTDDRICNRAISTIDLNYLAFYLLIFIYFS